MTTSFWVCEEQHGFTRVNTCSLDAVGRTVELGDLIDAHGVADLLGLSQRNSVSRYQQRYPAMPKPVIDLGPGRPKLWLRSQVTRWARARERANGERRRGGAA